MTKSVGIEWSLTNLYSFSTADDIVSPGCRESRLHDIRFCQSIFSDDRSLRNPPELIQSYCKRPMVISETMVRTSWNSTRSDHGKANQSRLYGHSLLQQRGDGRGFLQEVRPQGCGAGAADVRQECVGRPCVKGDRVRCPSGGEPLRRHRRGVTHSQAVRQEPEGTGPDVVPDPSLRIQEEQG